METHALVAPVTSLEFIGDHFLLKGEGPLLTVYGLQPHPKASSSSLNVLQHYRIHGVRPRPLDTDLTQSQYDLVVFGGKAVRLVRLLTELHHGDPHLKAEGPLMELHDWALDIRWLPGEERPIVGVALAHNSALLLDAGEGETLAWCSCLEGCLLYSSLFITDTSWVDSVLVGGTVFNQLVLWKPGAGDRGELGHKAPVERRLLGHSGVIFSLSYLRDKGWLASASDDRSVRVWGVGVLGGPEGSCGDPKPTCLRVFYGHQARVFSVRLAPGKVFSAGEDGACLVWDWAGGGRVAQTLKGHRAGGVRALAVSEPERREGRGERWVATGGADGGVRLWRVEGGEEEKEEACGEVEKETETLMDLRFSGQGLPKVVRVVGGEEGSRSWTHSIVVVSTDLGLVYQYIDSQWKVAWEGGPDFQSYCVMETLTVRINSSHSKTHLCAVGNLSGAIWLFPLSHPNSGVQLDGGPGKIHSLIWVGGQGREKQGGYLLASGAEGLVRRWYVEVEMSRETRLVLRVETLASFLLPSCAKRWLTAAVRLHPRPEGALWVCGDRRGSLLLFQEKAKEEGEEQERINSEVWKDGTDSNELVMEDEKENDVEDEEKKEGVGEEMKTDKNIVSPLQPVSCRFGVHGKQGVTWVCEHHGLLYSAGRDGCVRISRIRPAIPAELQGEHQTDSHGSSSGRQTLQLEILRVQRACKGMEWLERVLILETPGSAAELRDSIEEEKEEEEEGVVGFRKRHIEADEKMASLKNLEAETGENHKTGHCDGREARFAVAGFHGVNFVVWDPVRQERLLSVPCGGGHRSWGLWPTQRNSMWPGHSALIFIKQGSILASQPPGEAVGKAGKLGNTSGWSLREGVHGRGIGCVCRLGEVAGPWSGSGFQAVPGDQTETSCTGREAKRWEILVTGGEDTSLTVLAVQQSSGEVQVLSVITDHISSVRTLTAITHLEDAKQGTHTRSLSSLLVSAGGRAQMQCYRLLIRWDGQRQAPACQVIQVAGHRLDEQWERRRNRHKTVKMDPETRYMCVAVVDDDPDCVLLALGCSDGAVRLFSVSEVKGQFELLWESFHHQRCVLSVATCCLEDVKGNRCSLLFSAATDGQIAVWDLTKAASLLVTSLIDHQSPPTPRFILPAHQSGINSLAVWAEPPEQQENGCLVTVASGGDDGQLTVSVIRVQYLDRAVDGSRVAQQPQDMLCEEQHNKEGSLVKDSLPQALASQPPCQHQMAHLDVQTPLQQSDSLANHDHIPQPCVQPDAHTLPIMRLHLHSQSSVPLAHAAPLTALKLLSPGLLVSTSPDQRVCLWRIHSSQVSHAGALYSHVADAAGLATWVSRPHEKKASERLLVCETERQTGEEMKGKAEGEMSSDRGGRSETVGEMGRQKGEETDGETRCETGGEQTAEMGSERWVVVCGQGLQLLQVRRTETDGGMDSRGKRSEAEHCIKVKVKEHK